jgi:hypothetical protein
MNEAYLTGEPFEIAKTPGSEVLSGSINCDSALNIRAEKLAVDSRYARIMQVIQDAEQRPRIRRLGDKLGAWYTPLALSLAGIAWAATGESHRFLAVLVVATTSDAGQTNTQTTTTAKELKETFLRRPSSKHEIPSNPIRCAREYSVSKTACLAPCRGY